MATVIDALVVTLGLNSKAFTLGAKGAIQSFGTVGKQAESTAKNIEASGKQAAMFFAKLRNEALTFFAVFTAGVGIKDFISGTINGAAGLGRMAENLQMSTRELSAWQKAAERAGGTAEGITAQLKESQSESAKYASGITPSTIQAFAKYGGNFDAFRSGNAYLLERSRIIQEMFAKSPARAALAAQELGISEENYNLIKQGPAALQALIAAQMKNSVVTEADAREAQKLQEKLLNLRDTLQATAQRVVFALAPAIEMLVARFQTFADWALENKDVITKWITDAVDGVVKFAKALDAGVDSIGGWKTVLMGLIALNLLPTVAAMVALAAAILSVGKATATASTATAAAAASGGLWSVLKRLGVGAALLTHTDELGAGEMEDLARRRALGATIDEPGGRAPTASGMAARNQVIDSLMAKGWTRAQAAGIAANFEMESNYNTGAVGDGGKAYGIAQWHPDRQKEFQRYHGKPIQGSSLEEQIEFADYELHNTEAAAGNRLKKTTTAREAGDVVSRYYERPANADWDAARRGQLANTLDQGERARMAAWAAANPDNARATVGAGAGQGIRGVSTSTSEVNIEKIEVVTQATDAQGIARDMGAAVRQNGLVTQANTGLQ